MTFSLHIALNLVGDVYVYLLDQYKAPGQLHFYRTFTHIESVLDILMLRIHDQN